MLRLSPKLLLDDEEEEVEEEFEKDEPPLLNHAVPLPPFEDDGFFFMTFSFHTFITSESLMLCLLLCLLFLCEMWSDVFFGSWQYRWEIV